MREASLNRAAHLLTTTFLLLALALGPATVALSAQLTLGSLAIAIQSAEATIRGPGGKSELVSFTTAATGAVASWKRQSSGAYAIDLTVTGTAPDGTQLERMAFLAVEAQPKTNLLPTYLFVGGVALVLLTLPVLAALLAFWVGRRLNRRR